MNIQPISSTNQNKQSFGRPGRLPLNDRKIEKEIFESKAQDLAKCWDGLGVGKPTKLERRAAQIINQELKQRQEIEQSNRLLNANMYSGVIAKMMGD